MSFTFRRHKKLHKQAYAAFDSGELAQAARARASAGTTDLKTARMIIRSS